MPNNKPIAAKGKQIPVEKWSQMLSALSPMAKKGYEILYEGVYNKDKTNLYPGDRGTDYIDFPSDEYDYKTNPINNNIVAYIMDGNIGKSKSVGVYKPGKYEKKPHKYLGNWLSSTKQVTPDTIMVSDDAQSPTDIIAHELMHIELPSVGSIDHIDRHRRMGDSRNQKRFADIVNKVKAEKSTSSSIRDILELSMLEAYDSEIKDTYK